MHAQGPFLRSRESQPTTLRRRGDEWRPLLALTLALLGSSCSLVATSDVARGLGSPCTSDADCQAARCIAPQSATTVTGSICAIACSADTDCPKGTVCAKSLCQTPLSVGVALTGNVTELEGWTYAHVQALDKVASELGYIKLDKHFGLIPGNVLNDIIGIAQTNQLVLGNTFDYVPDFKKAAMNSPTNNFACVDDGVYALGTANFNTYWVRREEAWYVAGKVAATIAKSRLGVISAFINPETVLDVNAFALGAQSVKPGIVVEVRYIGFWYDINGTPTFSYTHKGGLTKTYYREEYLAAQLIDSGCEVIAHLGNTQRSVRLIESLRSAGLARSDQYSFANDNQSGYLDGSGQSIKSCVGAIYENWQPLYRDLFEAIHRGVYDPSVQLYYDITDTDASPTGVSINPSGPGDSIAERKLTQDLARSTNPGPRQRVLLGPYTVNGQRDRDLDGIPDPDQRVASGEVISLAEASKLCWYVQGVVEKTILSDPTSPDRQALVPGGLVPGAKTPGSRVSYPTDDQLVVPTGLSGECLKNTF